MRARVRVSPTAGVCVLLSIVLLTTSAWGSSAVGGGIIVSAERANVGTAKATAGTTIFAGDNLGTDQLGSLQVRAGAARVLLTASSHITWGDSDGLPDVVLTAGNVVFSTANSKAMVLHASKAVFRPRDDSPSIGSVTLLNPKELVVKCSRGAITIAVEDDVRVIPEGSAYHVVLDANPTASSEYPPQWGRRDPRPPGKSKFIWYAIAFTAVVTFIAVYEACESPHKPKK